jgi:hypothetical protein
MRTPVSRIHRRRVLVPIVIALFANLPATAAHVPRAVLPDAVVDLRTAEGAARVAARWRYTDAHLHEIDHRSAGRT